MKIVSTHLTRKSFVTLEGCFTFGAISDLLYLPGDGGIGLADLALLGHDAGLQHGGEIVVGDDLPSGDRGDVVVALDQHGLSVQVDMHGGLGLLPSFLTLILMRLLSAMLVRSVLMLLEMISTLMSPRLSLNPAVMASKAGRITWEKAPELNS